MGLRFFLLLSFITIWTLPKGRAQKDSYNWYFGLNAAVTFNPNGNPSPVSNNAMSSGKGCASISDSCSGQLYFYTNGRDVWNRNNVIMPNGTGLAGNSTTTQSAVIVSQPNDNTGKYFVFTSDANNNVGLKYSIVDMTLAGGLGDVITTSKNTPLIQPTLEKITALRHINDRDIWIITHELNTNAFYAYLLEPTGVNATPVISNVGPVYNTNDQEGYMKASPDGSKLALALKGNGRFDIFDFDNANGMVSNPRSSANTYNLIYGIEFSPDGSKVYVTSNSSGLYQHDLNFATPGNPVGPATFISPNPTVAIQLGPKGIIYTNEGNFLGAINKPNEAGNACNYTAAVVSLTGFAASGLPTFMQSYFSPLAILGDEVCLGIPMDFRLSQNKVLDSVRWDFGEPSGGAQNTSNLPMPSYNYTDTGVFTVTAYAFTNICGQPLADTVTRDVHIVDLPIPNADLGLDTVICAEDQIELITDGTAQFYLWSDNSTDTALTADIGTYWVEATNACGTVSDTITISGFESQLDLDLGPDTSICEGRDLPLNASQVGEVTYKWSTGSDKSIILVQEAGRYWVEATDKCYTAVDSLRLKLDKKPRVDLGSDTTICNGQIYILDATHKEATYSWHDDSKFPIHYVGDEGSYYVFVSNKCGSSRDDVYIRKKDCDCHVYVPSSFTPNKDGLNEEFKIMASCDFVEYRLDIYNRHGNRIYTTENPKATWKGEVGNKEIQSENYIYHLRYRSNDPFNQEVHELRGTVVVLK